MLSLIESNFQARAEQPVLDGGSFRGLPDRAIGAAELRSRLLDRALSHDTNDRIWTHLVTRVRQDADQTDRLVCLGLALPGLRHAVGRAQLACRDAECADLEAEAVTGFLHAADIIDLRRHGLCGRLCQAAHTAARSYARNVARNQQASVAAVEIPENPPTGHVDQVLIRAILEGIITSAEARLIGATRLDGEYLSAIARRTHSTALAVGIQRRRAEERLGAWLSPVRRASA